MPKLNKRNCTYVFLNVCDKIHQFLSSIKKDAHKKIGSFFLPHSVELVGSVPFVLNIPPYKIEYIYII